MSTTDEKSGRRKGKGDRRKKAVSQKSLPAGPAPAQLQSPDQAQELKQPELHAESPSLDQQPAIEEPVVAVIASPEPLPAAAPPPSEPLPAEPVSAEPVSAESVSVESVSVEPVSAESASAEPASAELTPVSLQTIANAYRDYTKKSLEEFGSFVEQLSGVRSLDKAMTVQSEFVKRAYETSVAESQKICELHNRLAKQTLDPFKGVTTKTPATHGKS